jgi:hypothetical protein
VHQFPRKSYVGRQLEGIHVKIVDDQGKVDTTVDGCSHSISADWMKNVTIPFTRGECILPPFKLPGKPGLWEGNIFFSANASLSVTIQVSHQNFSASKSEQVIVVVGFDALNL